MKITITPTEMLTRVDQVPVRVWEGVTENGVPCRLFIAAVWAHRDANLEEFETALKELQAVGGRFITFDQAVGS